MGSRVSVPRSVLAEAAQCLARQGGPWADTMAGKLLRLAEPVRKRSKPSRLASKKEKAQKKKEEHSDWAAVRAEVFKRANGCCENPDCGLQTETLTPDHFFGRKRHECIETVWALCVFCDKAKTVNHPSALDWARAFLRHAARYGYAKGRRCASRRIALEVGRERQEQQREAVAAESLVTTGRYPQEPLKLSGRASGD